MSVQEFRQQIENDWKEVPAAIELCLLILDFLEETDRSQLEMLTFRTLANAAKREQIDGDVMTAIQILTSSSLEILDAKALFVDEDEPGYELTDEELEEVSRSGTLVHPDTGQVVENYEEHLVPFFVATERFLAERQSA